MRLCSCASSPALTRSAPPRATHSDCFGVLGVSAARGRLLGPADEAAADWNGVVMSWGTWERDFGLRPDIIGMKLTIDEATYSVVGVTPRYFTDPLGFPVNDIETAFFRLHRSDERRGPTQ